MTHRVAVLQGGFSSEREVSLATGAQVVSALRDAGFEVLPIEVTRDLPALIAALQEARPDVVFNALHGPFGEDGCIQGVLDWLKLPYTHSGVRASSVAMDKHAAKAVFAAAGLPLAAHRIVSPEELETADPLPRPYVVKPVNEGSSVGVEILREGDNRRADIARRWSFGPQIMAEEYIPGRELTVAVMGDEPLAVTEIGTGHIFYDYEAKYAAGGSQHTIPAQVPETVAQEAMRIARSAHEALGCRGVSRSDLRYDEASGRVVLLEVNTQPGMTRTSLVPEQAAYRGIGFSDLCAWMVQEARHGP
ncbi:D-alanine--D-alanine ligase [Roseomonas marmotae]|uniref:D-alanine--D-alanine ligase n=1 Tax=Roseomonas marmotae TaxID=2768161 RepID=A0ABS3KDT1_9PROT|nr:D-alanine--D-alanine ligase [Roseomonas marmotae]MBO1074808.1 D-alanine--D-alanine ligase [Roseomonas marmotae]QTI80683.1 D-alanine--D-alanine ligase [Roseomonas marmotae]